MRCARDVTVRLSYMRSAEGMNLPQENGRPQRLRVLTKEISPESQHGQCLLPLLVLYETVACFEWEAQALESEALPVSSNVPERKSAVG